MDRILVEVDDIAAKNWRYATVEKKNELNNTISNLIINAFNKSDDDFWAFMARVGKEAEANGLTQEILDKILNEE